MKKIISVFLTSIFMLTLFVGCNKTEKLTEGTDNDKIVGAWLLVNNTDGARATVRYWEFKDDGITIMCDYLERQENDTIIGQTYEEMPWPYTYKTYYIDKDVDGFSDRIGKYPYSYTEGHGLEYQEDENNIVTLTEKEGWHFKFINENKFILTTDEETFGFYSEYHGYRLKEPLL